MWQSVFFFFFVEVAERGVEYSSVILHNNLKGLRCINLTTQV